MGKCSKFLLPTFIFILFLAMISLAFKYSNMLNKNNGVLMLLFTAVVAFSTAVYAYLTWKLVAETKEMRKAQTEPNISITVEPREEWINFMDIKIMNIGSGPAYDVKFKIEPDFEFSKGHFLSQKKVMKEINYLAPNQKIQFFLTSLAENFHEKMSKPFKIKAEYKNKGNDTFSEDFVIDFSQFEGMSQLGEPPLHKIAKNIEDIKEDIHHLSTGFNRLKTIVYTKRDIEDEQKEMINRTDDSKKEQSQTTPLDK